MSVYAADLICSTGVSGFQTFKPVFCIYNKLRLHAEMFSWWADDVIFSRSNPLMSYRSVSYVSHGGPSNPKLTLKIDSLQRKRKAQKFCQLDIKRIRFQNRKKKRKWFFDHSTTLIICHGVCSLEHPHWTEGLKRIYIYIHTYTGYVVRFALESAQQYWSFV